MSINISKQKREDLLNKIEEIRKYISNAPQDENTGNLLSYLSEIEKDVNGKKYGLVFEEHREDIDEVLDTHTPVLTEDKDLFIDNGGQMNYLIEGDNLASLKLLEKTHEGMIDVIYIDPPYNRGDNDFIYDDKYVDKNDLFKHSKWLSFMYNRLFIAKKLLSNQGIIIINIDEHESAPLSLLLNELFGDTNNLGDIVWNKKNPKGDSQGVSTMHETILCFCKNKEIIIKQENLCKRKKANAEAMITKAKSLYKKIGKKAIPEDVKIAIKPFNYGKDVEKDFYVIYDLDLVNKEYQNWLKNQSFSNGEKAYKYIDNQGRVYRGVSMAWPNKKKAPDNYFIPLIHPVTKKECPIPERGWRNPPDTMNELLNKGLILFGDDEKKQPERKYYLDENLIENTPSIYENADSSDDMLSELGLKFDYAKPVSEAIYVLQNLHPNPKIILDFFAGSGTTGHAVLRMNSEDNKNRQFILCTNNENNICRNLTYERIRRVIEKEDYNASLKYYKVEYVPITERLYYEYADELLMHIRELVELENGINFIGNAEIAIVLTDEELDDFTNNVDKYTACKKLYMGHDLLPDEEQERIIRENDIEISIIPDYYYKDLQEK